MDINLDPLPPDSGSGSYPVPSGPAAFSAQNIEDSVSAYNTQQLAEYLSIYNEDVPGIPIPVFSSIMLTSRRELNEQLFAQDIFNFEILKKFYYNMVANALKSLEILGQVRKAAKLIAEATALEQSLKNTLNSAINHFNNVQITSDVDAVNTLNAAIDTYNASGHTQADLDTLNAAIDDYNSYATSRNGGSEVNTLNNAIATYNNGVDDVRDLISQANALLTQAGLPTVSQQQYYSPSTVPNLNTYSHGKTTHAPIPSNRPTATITINPSSLDVNTLVIQLSKKKVNQVLAENDSVFQLFKALSDRQSFLLFYFSGRVKTLPTAYLAPFPDLFLNTANKDAVGQGSGVSLAGIISGLNSPHIITTLIDSARQQQTAEQGAPLDSNTKYKLQYLLSSFLQEAGLYSSSAALQLLKNNYPKLSGESNSATIAANISYAQIIQQVIGGGDFEKLLTGILAEAYPDLDANALKSIGEAVSKGLSLFFVSASLSALAQAIGLPNLLAQLTSTLPAGQDLSVLQTLNDTTVRDILNDDVKQGYLKNTLAERLIQDGVISDRVKAQNAINDAINLVINNTDISDETSFREAVKDALLKNEVLKNNVDEANRLSDLALSYVKAENRVGESLDSAVNTDNINREGLIAALKKEDTGQANINDAVVSTLLSKEYTSARDLRDTLANNLTKKGVDQGTAILAATNALVSVLNPPTPTFEPTTSAQLQQTVRDAVIKNISPELGTQEANKFADQINDLIFNGDQSYSNKLNSLLTDFKAQDDQNVTDAVNDQLRTFLKPTLSLYKFNQEIMDPAYTLLKSWSIMTAPQGEIGGPVRQGGVNPTGGIIQA